MTRLAQEYIAFRRRLGYQIRIEGQQLLVFARWADRIGHRGPLTTDLALRWARLPQNAAPLYYARRLEVVRCFARHRAIADPRTQIPPQRLLGPAHGRRTPYIYSVRQIRQLLTCAGRLAPCGGLRPRTYRTLFGLLACSGLRISEALKLRRQDVDLELGLLRINPSKFFPRRTLPLHPTALAELRRYAQVRDRCYPLAGASTFFLSQGGRPLASSTVHTAFRRICQQQGWVARPGQPAPRLHDLRHTFACRNLLRWYRQGKDVEHAILNLSNYLGHRKITDTYWYLTGIPELLAIAGRRFETCAASPTGGRP
jgi:integrase